MTRLAADAVDENLVLFRLLTDARWYVSDALEAHEHEDGRALLTEIDQVLARKVRGGDQPETPER